MSGVSSRAVSVVTLGRMGFMAAYDVQMRFARCHLDELAGRPNIKGVNTLLVVEHTPVYTVGIRTKDYTQDDVSRLKQTGAEFYKTNRGGLITFHGPGQLVAYPILNLLQFKPSLKWYVSQLEQTLIETLQKFGIQGRTTDQTGVWVGDRKIASIGLHGSRYVTTHGISLNCNTDLSWFKHIVPCGLEGVEVTSLTKELEHHVPYQDAIKPFLSSFQNVFDCDLQFKMLDQNELKLIGTASSPKTTQQRDLEGGVTDSAGVVKRVELGQRHMSTMSGPESAGHYGDKRFLPKLRPMW